MDPRYAEIAAALRAYADGLYHSDASLLERIFHPEARYISVSDGPLVNLPMAEYLPMVADRASPEARGEAWDFAIEEIAFAGPDTAMARMRCRMLGRDYTDLLSLVRTGGAWRIVAKLFHHRPLA